MDNELINVLKRLLKENRELRNNIDVLEKILHLSLPIIGEEKDDES